MIKTNPEKRILVLAPTGRDAALLSETLHEDAMDAVICRDAATLLDMLPGGAAAAIMADESLSNDSVTQLGKWVSQQPPWSDIPFVVLTARGIPRPSTTKRAQELSTLGNVTLLERPVRPETVRSWMRAAVRARLRQYEMRDRQETLVRVNADLEQFAYSASHDLKEPIRNIAIYSELLTLTYADTLDDQGKQFLQFMISGAKQIEILVNDLLLFTQSASIFDETPSPISAMAPLQAALASLRETIRESEASIIADPLPQVRIRDAHLQQLFQNLIGNSIKYRREALRVHIGVKDQEDHWTFSVEDNGIGFDPHYKDQIFGIFKRLHTSREYTGTGIGLAICQRIVQRYRGRIWADSQLGKGSTFFFSIPK